MSLPSGLKNTFLAFAFAGSILTAATAVPAPGSASEVELGKVKASLVAALIDVSAFSREVGKTVLPLRTNDELEEITFMCEALVIEHGQELPGLPAICGPIQVPLGDFDVPFFGAEFSGS